VHCVKVVEDVVVKKFTFAISSTDEFLVELECGPMPNVMAAQPNIDGALCESSVIPFLVYHAAVWLTLVAGCMHAVTLPI